MRPRVQRQVSVQVDEKGTVRTLGLLEIRTVPARRPNPRTKFPFWRNSSEDVRQPEQQRARAGQADCRIVIEEL